MSSKTITPEPLQVDVRTAAAMIGISKSFLYELMSDPDFPITPVRLGSKVLFNRKRLIEYVEAGCPPRQKWECMKQYGGKA